MNRIYGTTTRTEVTRSKPAWAFWLEMSMLTVRLMIMIIILFFIVRSMIRSDWQQGTFWAVVDVGLILDNHLRFGARP